MMTKLMLLRDVLLAVHLLAAAAWVGGMFYALVILTPALSQLDPQARMQLQMRTLKRFFLLVWHVMPLMLLTGWAMVALVWGGFAALPWSINLMQILAIVMALVFLYVFFGPWTRLRRAIRPGPEIMPKIRTAILANLLLGSVAIIAGALGHSW